LYGFVVICVVSYWKISKKKTNEHQRHFENQSLTMSDYYKNCFVPKCTNSTLKTAGKLFFHVPKGGTRKKWCTIARRDQTKSLSSNLFCCEDHFDVSRII
jgi:THAP domain.